MLLFQAFNSMFHFPISYVAMQKVNVRLMNHADRTTLGTYSFNISDVANSGGTLAGSWPLENSNVIPQICTTSSQKSQTTNPRFRLASCEGRFLRGGQ